MPKAPKSLDEIVSRSITLVDIPSLAPGTSQIIGRVEVAPSVTAKKFAAQFTSRVGAFSESINVRRVDGAWLFATRMRVADAKGDIVFRKIDPQFPLNKDGDVDW